MPTALKLSPALFSNSDAAEAEPRRDRGLEGQPNLDGHWAHSDEHFLTLTYGENVHRHSLDRETDNKARTRHVNGRLTALGRAGGSVPEDARRRFFWADSRIAHNKIGTANRAKALATLLDGLGGLSQGHGHGRRLQTQAAATATETETDADGCDFERLSLRDDRRGHVSILGHQKVHPDVAKREACLQALLVELATVPDVLHVGISSKPKISNSDASAIVQTGDGAHPNTHPFWAHGITGKGQIVQVGDTGLDQYSCFFHDDDGVVATTAKSDIPDSMTTDLTKRKVVQYAAWVDEGDYRHGHGTHVSGSVAGNVKSSWTGVPASDSCTSTSDSDGIESCDAPNYYGLVDDTYYGLCPDLVSN